MKDREIDFELPGDSRSKMPKYLSIAASAVLVAGSLMVAGAKVQQSMTPERLPANQQCLASSDAVKLAASTFSAQLVAALDGEKAPAPDLSAVRKSAKECRETQDQVTVKVEATR